MVIEVLKEAPKDCTRKAAAGDVISMHYRGTLENGNEFDSSYSRNQPFEFKLGAGMVIAGWEQGVPGMCIGEKRKLTIPSHLAYGDRGFGDIIPAKSTLIFEIELIGIKGYSKDTEEKYEDLDKEGNDEEEEGNFEDGHTHDHPDTFEALDLDGNKEISMEEMKQYIKKYHDASEEVAVDDENSVETIVGEIFQEDDKNKDGVISFQEYQHSAAGLAEEEEGMEQGDYHDHDHGDDGKDEL